VPCTLALRFFLLFAQSSQDPIGAVAGALRAGEFAKALEILQPALEQSPENSQLWTLQGLAYSGEGHKKEALASFRSALKISPDYLPALKGAAQLEYQAGNADALPFLEKLLELNQDDQTAHAMMAALAFKRKDCATAIAHYEKCLELVESNVPALSQFGACLFRLNRAEEALARFQRIAELRPQDSEAVYYLGLAQYQGHHNKDAIRTLLPLAEDVSGKEREAALNLIAAAYEADEQTPQAVDALQKAIALAPDSIDNYLDLATLSLNHEAFNVGIDVLNAGLRVKPDAAPLYLERGVLEVQMEKYDEANADFRRAADLSPLDNASSVALGVSLLQENKVDESLQIVRHRLAKEPDDPTLNYLLAELMIRKGVQPGTPSFQRAKAAAQRAVRTKPDLTVAQDVLTQLYLRSGETALAEKTARLALASDHDDQTALYNLIVCLRKRGDQRELLQLVQRLAEITAALREQEKARNRFKLVEEQAAESSREK